MAQITIKVVNHTNRLVEVHTGSSHFSLPKNNPGASKQTTHRAPVKISITAEGGRALKDEPFDKDTTIHVHGRNDIRYA